MRKNFRLLSITKTFPAICRVRVYDAMDGAARLAADEKFDAYPDAIAVNELLRDPTEFIRSLDPEAA